MDTRVALTRNVLLFTGLILCAVSCGPAGARTALPGTALSPAPQTTSAPLPPEPPAYGGLGVETPPRPAPTNTPPATVPLPTPVPPTVPLTTVPPTLDWTSSTVLAERVPFREVAGQAGYPLWQITDNPPLGASYIAWSPDGQHVVVYPITDYPVENTSPAISVVLNVQTGVRNLVKTFYQTAEQWSSWSPDGSLLAYSDGQQLWLTGADGQSRRVLALPAGESPAEPVFSPDGQLLALRTCRIVGDRGVYQVAVLDLEGRLVQQWTQGPGWGRNRPSWSSDGQWLAYADYDDSSTESLWIANLASGEVRGVSLAPFPGSEVPLPVPRWLWQDQSIWTTLPLAGQAWVVDRNGTILQHWDARPQGAGGRPAGYANLPPGRFWAGYSVSFSLSPSGRYLLLCSPETALYDWSTGQRQALAGPLPCGGLMSYFAWSPDERWVLIGGNRGDTAVVALSTEQGKITPFLPGETVFEEAWSPNGQRVAYIKVAAGQETLYIQHWPDGVAEAVSPPWPAGSDRSGAIRGLAWSPDGTWVSFLAQTRGWQEAYVVQVGP